jgi:hypothetical protein
MGRIQRNIKLSNKMYHDLRVKLKINASFLDKKLYSNIEDKMP